MEPLRTILIEDEQSSLENLHQKLTEFCPSLRVIATSMRPEEAILLIRHHKPEVVFLDIEMPRMDGFRMLQEIKEVDFEVIFVTAYNQYAIEAIRFSAFDYLVKPVVIKELQAAVERLADKSNHKSKERFEALRQKLSDPRSQENTIPVPTSDGIEFLQIKDIIRIESSSNYSRLILIGGRILVVAKLLREFEELLSPYRFYRVHNSHLINLLFVKKYVRGDGGQIILRNGDVVDVSRRKKDEFLQILSAP